MICSLTVRVETFFVAPDERSAGVDLVIQPDGTLHCVYDEAIDLAAFGQLTISRGSHVEPDSHGQWFADLAPVSGPRLGPFVRRSEALTAERSWLESQWLTDGRRCCGHPG